MSYGPLHGLRVVELEARGPAPHACMMLADLGAQVLRVARGDVNPLDYPPRGRTVVQADLKSAADRDRVLELIADADVLIEGFRPGVLERLGLGPDVCLARNPRLVIGRMTGWGQDGPFAANAGHDLNYISITGVLDNIGPADGSPVVPLNLIGDFGGGSMFLVAGILAALWERQRSGRGQVIDAAMCDGTSVLAHLQWGMRGIGAWSTGRGANILDGSRPYYTTYACSDGRYVAVGCLEPKFFATMLQILQLDAADLPGQYDETRAVTLRDILASTFQQKTMQDWAAAFLDTDACVTPVLTYDEALDHPHLRARNTFTTIDGVHQPSPAPRFSRSAPPAPDAAHQADLADWHW